MGDYPGAAQEPTAGHHEPGECVTIQAGSYPNETGWRSAKTCKRCGLVYLPEDGE